MSKKYLNKTCAYCGADRSSTTADHVIARLFFHEEDRSNLPKVPACARCNNLKSQLELYVLSVMPLGGLQPKAGDMLRNFVDRRLQKNNALRTTLAVGARHRLFWSIESGWQEGMTMPFDSEKLTELSRLIAQGLAWHHWRLQLAPEADIRANMFSAEGEAHWQKVWKHPSWTEHVCATLGNGEFSYRGVRARDSSMTSLWQMTYFGGAQLGADPDKPGQTTKSVFVASMENGAWKV
ncbi:HNH endonuclease [Burkholderia multivorans]|uniref:HNH endonuclease n=1 Tax=Burkholderia multivorans TaxID=87883 RepID=UPI0021BFFA17|nr:HNH endonuclease signature motif containing protein [Burkholderia multivorans]